MIYELPDPVWLGDIKGYTADQMHKAFAEGAELADAHLENTCLKIDVNELMGQVRRKDALLRQALEALERLDLHEHEVGPEIAAIKEELKHD